MSIQKQGGDRGQESVGQSSDAEQRIDAALRALLPPWHPTVADHKRLMDALEHTPQDEPLHQEDAATQ